MPTHECTGRQPCRRPGYPSQIIFHRGASLRNKKRPCLGAFNCDTEVVLDRCVLVSCSQAELAPLDEEQSKGERDSLLVSDHDFASGLIDLLYTGFLQIAHAYGLHFSEERAGCSRSSPFAERSDCHTQASS